MPRCRIRGERGIGIGDTAGVLRVAEIGKTVGTVKFEGTLGAASLKAKRAKARSRAPAAHSIG